MPFETESRPEMGILDGMRERQVIASRICQPSAMGMEDGGNSSVIRIKFLVARLFAGLRHNSEGVLLRSHTVLAEGSRVNR